VHISQFAEELRCRHCNKTHGTTEWPLRGDYVPFYFQDEAGRYSLKVRCPHCGKDWYVVWDQDPGAVTRLGI
jgi:rRNA maturation protein Nop10